MRRVILPLFFALSALSGALGGLNAAVAGDSKPAAPKQEALGLAVIVHPKNPVKKLSFSELRAFLKVKQQFWPNRQRCRVFLPPTRSAAYGILLKRVYKMSHKKLQKYWVRQLFSGQIPSKPDFVSSSTAAGSQVRKALGALSIVPANRVPKGVKVLLIDGKRPGDKGYALVGTIKP